MNIMLAEFYNNEGFLQTVDVYEYPEIADSEAILDFIEFTKKQMNHTVISRNKINILFSDGIRVVLKSDELIRMADVKDYLTIVKTVDTTITAIGQGSENEWYY